MKIEMNSTLSRISKMRTGVFEQSKEKTDKTSQKSDELEISQEGQEAVEKSASIEGDDIREFAEKLREKLGNMTKEEFDELVTEWKKENQTQLKVNPYLEADPDCSFAAKSYMQFLAAQVDEDESIINNYYADAYQEAKSPSLVKSLNYIASKYQCSWSENFEKDMPADERQWTYTQLREMLTGGRVKLNDPYAMKDAGGVKSFDQIDQAARQAVREQLEQLMKEKGITPAD